MKKKWTLSSGIAVFLALVLYLLLPRQPQIPAISLDQVPAYGGQPWVVLEDNQPRFTMEDKDTQTYEYYEDLDAFNRCTYAIACIGRELMPTEERGQIGQVKPSGWETVKYDFVDGKYLYNRCHLIGYQLTGENANERNLITGTRYMNVEGMLPFENEVAEYIKQTGNHVLYRVVPVFEGDNLLASGVTMEAWSLEDQGAGICFYVYIYNVQPGVEIDYTTGESRLAEVPEAEKENYILNTSSRKFHDANCTQAQSMKPENRQEIKASHDLMIAQGYVPAGCCNP